MKRLFIFSAFIFCFSFSNAQTPLDWQDFDKSVKDTTFLRTVEYGEFCSFKMIDINKFFYAVTIEGTKVELETPIPTELQQLFRLSPEELKETADEEDQKEAEEEVEKMTNELMEEMKSDTDSSSKNKMQKELDDFSKKMKKLNTKYYEAINDIHSLKKSRIDLVNLALMDIAASEMKSRVLALPKPVDPSKSLKNFTEAFRELKDVYDGLILNADSDLKKKIKAYFGAFNKLYEEMDEETIYSLYSDVSYLYNELQNKKNFIVQAPPVQANEDLIHYSVTVTPSKSHSLGPYNNPMTFGFDVRVRGGLKVDFSVGPVFSIGKNAKDDKLYLTDSDSADYSILKQRDNNNIVKPGIAAMMHFYVRSGQKNSFGGLLGVGAGFESIEDVNLNYFLGLSCVTGLNRKIMISGGLSLLQVDRLKEGEYTIDDEYLTSEIDINDVTEKVYQPSLFLSVGFSIAQRRTR